MAQVETVPWANAIVGYRLVPPDQLLAHPKNPRRHPNVQRDALRASLRTLGWVAPVLQNVRTGHLIDGHARIEEALSAGVPEVPVIDVDLSLEQETVALATLDPIAAMASRDREALDALLREIDTGEQALLDVLAAEAQAAGLDYARLTDGEGSAEAAVARASLSDRFLIPPFSVLDARQGYWQERKRAWLALGIQSELGRGEATRPGSPGDRRPAATGDGKYSGGDCYRYAGPNRRDHRQDNGLLGESEQARSHYRTAAPGGSPRPAATLGPDGKTVRGDGTGQAFAQSFATGDARGTEGGMVQGMARNFRHAADSRAIKDHAWQAEQDARPQARILWDTVSDDETSRKNLAAQPQSGTSIFDPVLCELVYRWFSPPDGAVLDPFAGGSVRGIVASILGRRYTGVDISERQIAANREQAAAISPALQPTWHVGDSRAVADLAPGAYDLVFSCPPYADLEVYSDDPRDLSTLPYADFLAAYQTIIAASVALLAPDRFACFVVGDVRDPKGYYRNFVADTIAAFAAAGARLYNDAILVTAVGSLPIRVGKQFESSRKLGKTHQNVLVFCKGDPRQATTACGPVDVADPAEGFGEVV